MEVAGRRTDAKQVRAEAGDLHEHAVHEILGVSPVSSKCERVAEQGSRVQVVEFGERLLPALGQLPQQFAIPPNPLILTARHT